MKKKTNQLARTAMTLLLAVLGSIGVWAQNGVVTVGSTTYGHSYLPSSPDTKFSTSQQIYTSDEIGRSGMITSIAFYNYDAGSERNYDIYLSHTSKSSFETTADWVTVAETDKVFSGTINLSSGWTVIDFDVPFEYKGSQNLLLTVDDNTGKSTGYNYSIGSYSVSGHQTLFYYKSTNLDPTQPIVEVGVFHPSYTSDERKNCIQLCFETYPKPSKLEAVEVGDVSAQIQCSLRGEATAWNLRYRKVAGEGEEEQAWTVVNNLIDRSKSIEGLTALTKYEAQVQAVFPEDKLSDWTSPLVFTTACCPVEEQTEIIYAVNSDYSPWYGYAIQLMDVTDENNPREAAYINPPSYQFTGGTLTLCCGHKYKVNWIYDENHSNVNKSFSFALFFETGDKFFSMARGEAPTSTSELTTFVMDCTPYCVQMPQIVNEAGVTYDSATLTFVSQTKTGQVVYSTEEDFDPETATPADADFEELPQSEDPWGGTPPNTSVTLRGLQPLTTYYVSVRSVCTIEPLSTSRWTPPVKVTTGSRYDGPKIVSTEPVNSRSEKITFKNGGESTKVNLYYRAKVQGTPVSDDAIQSMGSGKGEGFEKGSWGENIWASGSEKPYSNILFVGGIGSNTAYSFNAGQGKTGADPEKFLYGIVEQTEETPLNQMKRLDYECMNDADKQARIKNLEKDIYDRKQTLETLYNLITNPNLSDEEKAQIEAKIAEEQKEIDELTGEKDALESATLNDDDKLQKMKDLESSLEQSEKKINELMESLQKGEITEAQYDEQIKDLNEEYFGTSDELNNLRAMMSAAQDLNKDGFTVVLSGSDTDANAPKARTRAGEDKKYVFFIRHSNGDGWLLINNLTFTPNDKLNAWTVVPNVTGSEYTITGLEPETTYEVMVEAVFDSGLTGSQSPIVTFTTIGEEADPVEGEFSVSATKKVQFAKGNLRYEGDSQGYEAEWSMAKQQYEVLGDKNIDVKSNGSSYPAYLKDLLCWSTTNNYYGVSNYYRESDEDAAQYFHGDFVDWGENPALIADLGEGWSTLSKDEWTYLLTERENADKLQSFAIISYKEGEEDVSVKGLILLPDDWTGDEPAATYTAETWKTLEAAGAVFLPVTGHLWSYEDENGRTKTVINGIDVIGNYWTSTPAGDKSDYCAFAARFNLNDSELTPNAEMERRLGCAIRLVKTITPKQELQDDWIIAIDDLDCTDSDQMPTLIVKDGETTLQEGVDYTVTYTNNKNVGTATATITFVEGSKYIGTASVTFNILRDMSNVFSTNNSWATYVAKEDLTTPDGLQAYTISAATASEVTATPIDYIPVGLAVLLNRADASVSAYKAKAYTETPATVTSLLVGSAAETTSLTPYQDFILFNDEFVLSSAASVAAGHAYLPAAKVPAGARTMTIVIDGEATAINSMKITTADNDGWYTVDGRQLNRMPAAKGVYIHHGKKYVIK